MINNKILTTVLCLLPLICGAQERNLSLEYCLELSHGNNPDVLNAALDSRAARAQKQEAFTNWFPNVSASAYGFHALNPLISIGLEDVLGSKDAAENIRYYAETAGGLAGVNTEWNILGHGYAAALSVVQPLFAGGRIANGNALANLGIKAADAKRSIAVRDTDDEVVRKYWTAAALAEKKKALQQAIDLVKSLEKDAVSAQEAGLVRQSDVLQVRLKGKELENTMIKLRSGERLAKMDLLNFIGMDYKVLDLDGISLCDGFDNLLPPESYRQDEAGMAASMDESRLLELSVEAKKLEKKMAVGEGLPQVGIGASLGYGQIIGNPRSNGAVFATVKIPISDWGKTSKKIQRCQYEIEKAENDKEYLDKQLLLKVNKEWIDLLSAWDAKEAAEEAVALSEMLESQKKDEYDAGLCTMSELLQTQTDLQAARSTLADCLAEYCKALSVWRK